MTITRNHGWGFLAGCTFAVAVVLFIVLPGRIGTGRIAQTNTVTVYRQEPVTIYLHSGGIAVEVGSDLEVRARLLDRRERNGNPWADVDTTGWHAEIGRARDGTPVTILTRKP